MARNIQRGRDHGLPGYNDFRELCGMDRHCDISKRPKEISEANWKILKGLYKHVNDIDLFTAGLAETPVKEGVTGPTFSCIKGLQFEALREGDRCD